MSSKSVSDESMNYPASGCGVLSEIGNSLAKETLALVQCVIFGEFISKL